MDGPYHVAIKQTVEKLSELRVREVQIREFLRTDVLSACEGNSLLADIAFDGFWLCRIAEAQGMRLPETLRQWCKSKGLKV